MSEKIECLKIDGRNYPLCWSCGWVEAEKSTMAFREGCHCVMCEEYIVDSEGNTAEMEDGNCEYSNPAWDY